MALIKFGGGITEMRGSIAGNVFSRNRYGAYSRARTKPINRNSQRQDGIRAIVSQVSQDWFTTLSDEQRAAWAVFAKNVPAKNKLGEVIYLSGFNQFVKSNVAALNAGLTAIADAPTNFTLPGADLLYEASVDVGTGLISIVFDVERPWCGEVGGGMIVQMGLPQNDSIGFFNGPWRHAGVILGIEIPPPTSPETLPVPFEVGEGQKVWVRAKIIRADGRLADWFLDIAIVTAEV